MIFFGDQFTLSAYNTEVLKSDICYYNDAYILVRGNIKMTENTATANAILENATITMPLKYLCNFWRSLEMPLINCKVELKLKWTKYCVLAATGAENANADSNDTISKTQNYMFPKLL